MNEELEVNADEGVVAVGSAAGVLFAGCVILLIFAFGQGLFAFQETILEIASRLRREWSPGREETPLLDPGKRGESPVYALAWGTIVTWLVATAVWLFVLAIDDGLRFYRSDRLFMSSLYVACALVLSGLWTLVFRFGTTCYLWMSTLILLFAHGLCVAAEQLLNPFSYPGVAIPLTWGVAVSLLSGWLLFGASLNYGMAVASMSARETMPAEPNERRCSIPVLVFALYAMIGGIAYPSPALSLWFFFSLFFFTPRKHAFLWWVIGMGVVGVFGGVLRVLLERLL